MQQTTIRDWVAKALVVYNMPHIVAAVVLVVLRHELAHVVAGRVFSGRARGVGRRVLNVLHIVMRSTGRSTRVAIAAHVGSAGPSWAPWATGASGRPRSVRSEICIRRGAHILAKEGVLSLVSSYHVLS